MVTKFKSYLAKTNLAKNTVTSYVWTVQYFLNHYEEINKKNLLTYKGYLVENFKPQTVNLRLQGINKYLEFTKQEKLKVKFVKVQQKNFLENVISDADYKFLKTRLKTDGYNEWYFIVWFMAATGARVSELLHIKAEHVHVGHLDLYSKGGKIRRLYIPKNLRTEATKWLKEKGLISGYIFLNRFGERITTRGIAQQLKHFAEKYGMNKEWFILIHSVIVLPRTSLTDSMTLPYLPTLWDMKVLKLLVSIFVEQPVNSKKLWTK